MRDGRLWFSTIRGLLVIDPEPSRAALHGARGRRLKTSSSTASGAARPTSARWSAGRNNVEFELHRRRASSRRRGSRSATCWRDSTRRGSTPDRGARRSTPTCRRDASGSVSRPARPDGACNESAHVVAFTIAPRFYQRAWFFPAVRGRRSRSAAGAIYQLRIRRLKEQFDLILAERGRIARELHDTLIQGFSGITMAMQALVWRLPSSSRSARRSKTSWPTPAARCARRGDRWPGCGATIRHRDWRRRSRDAARQLTEANDVRLKLDLADCQRPICRPTSSTTCCGSRRKRC